MPIAEDAVRVLFESVDDGILFVEMGDIGPKLTSYAIKNAMS